MEITEIDLNDDDWENDDEVEAKTEDEPFNGD
jgi:hypothetical protein